MRKLIIFLLLFGNIILSAQSGFGVVSAEDVNFRSTPEIKGELIKKIKLGTVAKILEGPVLKGNNLKWYKLQIGSQTGWIAADYIFDLKPLKDIGPSEFSGEKYMPCVAVSNEVEMMGSRANFIIMVEGNKLSPYVKSYPVLISKDVNDKIKYLQFYRNQYLSLEIMFDINKVLYLDELVDGTTTLAFSASYIYTSMYVFELKPKLKNGIFEAEVKFSYRHHEED